MDQATRRRLERIAWNHAAASRGDDEKWSFLFRTEGTVGYLFFPFPTAEAFDGDLDGLQLAWTPERVSEIDAGADHLAPEEFDEWRRAYAHSQIEAASEAVWPIWVVPVRLEGRVEGYATFLCREDDPTPGDVHETVEQAEAALSEQGALKRC